MSQLRSTGSRPWRGIAAALMVLALAGCGRPGAGTDRATGAENAPWSPHLQAVDEALAQQNISAAEWAWVRAHGAALGSRGWEGMLAVGDAARPIGALAGRRHAAEAKARTLYLAALFRARNQRSVEGVLQAAEAFWTLGDREVVEQCLAIAERLVGETREPDARVRAAALVRQFAARVRGAESAAGDRF